MKILYLDCLSGISGDMTVAALADAGASLSHVDEGLARLPVSGYAVSWRMEDKNGIRARRFCVHQHEHIHEHRTLRDIEHILNASTLSPFVKDKALSVFRVIAEAEGKIHGMAPEEVHFHEVGAVDSIVDIVAACLCVESLAPDAIYVSPLREGRGFVRCAHGLIPIPAPATLEILTKHGIPLEFLEEEGEHVTPTGAGLAAGLADVTGGPPPRGRILATGYGGGAKDFERPNVLRALLIETEETGAETDSVCVLETTVDDMTGEELGFAMERLFEAGALDAYFTPVYMKKNRPGHQLTVLCEPDNEQNCLHALLTHTSTLGVRVRSDVRRVVLPRYTETIQTPWGDIPVKVTEWAGRKRRKPEYDVITALARTHKIPLRTITAWIESIFIQKGRRNGT